tara:strand:+ start:492 stop:833 length:342 start_codon:yes stop_codon:yes gene_type:complete
MGERIGTTRLSALRGHDVVRPSSVEGDGKFRIVDQIGRVLGQCMTSNTSAFLASVEDVMSLSPGSDEGETDVHAHGIVAPQARAGAMRGQRDLSVGTAYVLASTCTMHRIRMT